MNWFKKHADSMAVVAILSIAIWTIKSDIHSLDVKLTKQIHNLDEKLSCKIISLDDKLSSKISSLDEKLSAKISGVQNELSHEIAMVNNEIVKIQTVMIIKGIVPSDLFVSENEEL